MSAPSGSLTTGQTSSRSTLSVQPSAISRAPSAAASASAAGSPQRRRRRSSDVPFASLAADEVVRDRVGDGRQVRRGAQDRRVVGVVRGAEEDRGRGRRDRGQIGVRAVTQGRVDERIARLDLVPVHERHDPDDLARRVASNDDERLLVGVRAVRVPPRSMEGPVGERRRPRSRGAQARPRSRRGMVSRSRRSARSGPAPAAAVSRVGVAGPGQAGSAARAGEVTANPSTGPRRWLRRQPGWTAPLTTGWGRMGPQARRPCRSGGC